MKLLFTCGVLFAATFTPLSTDCAAAARGDVEGANRQYRMFTGIDLPCHVQETLYQNALASCQAGQQQQ